MRDGLGRGGMMLGGVSVAGMGHGCAPKMVGGGRRPPMVDGMRHAWARHWEHANVDGMARWARGVRGGRGRRGDGTWPTSTRASDDGCRGAWPADGRRSSGRRGEQRAIDGRWMGSCEDGRRKLATAYRPTDEILPSPKAMRGDIAEGYRLFMDVTETKFAWLGRWHFS